MVSAVASIRQCVIYWWKCVPTRPTSIHSTRGSAEPLTVIPVRCWKGTVRLPWQTALVFCYWSLHKIASNGPFCLPVVCDSCNFFGGLGGGILLLCFCWLTWNSDYSCVQLWGRVYKPWPRTYLGNGCTEFPLLLFNSFTRVNVQTGKVCVCDLLQVTERCSQKDYLLSCILDKNLLRMVTLSPENHSLGLVKDT